MSDLVFYNKIVFRTPAYPISTHNIDIEDFIQRKDFQEAIYIASPVLYNQLQQWLTGNMIDNKEIAKLKKSLYKYLVRAQTRCTPFGLFASCSTAEWAEKTEITIEDKLKRHTRLDMDLVCMMADFISKQKDVRSRLLFYPNNSIYFLGEQIRYVECKYVNAKTRHDITAVERNEYLSEILNKARRGVCLDELKDLLKNKDIEKEEASEFIDELVNSQILISELTPTLTGDEFACQVKNILKRINTENPNTIITHFITILEKVEGALEKIDSLYLNSIDTYKSILSQLELLGFKVEEKNLIQVDSYREANCATLHKNIGAKILDALSFLQKIKPKYVSSDLENFKKQFQELYGDEHIPLLQVLDSESGIGFPQRNVAGINLMIDDLNINTNPERNIEFLKWNKKTEYLFRQLIEGCKKDLYVLNINDEAIKEFADDCPIKLATMSIFFKIVDSKSNKIQIINAGGGASAVNMLTRFGHGDEEIRKIIIELTQFEKKAYENDILAEIIHLPENRNGNLLLRPTFRDYEIPYLAQSSLPFENQILLEDITVSVKNDRIILLSKRLKREVLPRLTSAHNFMNSSLPVYRFLASLQLQDSGKIGLNFLWGNLSNIFKFLPRVEYKEVILSPAIWNLSFPDYSELCKNIDSIDIINLVKIWQEKWKMPRYIYLRNGENEFFVDLEKKMNVDVFLRSIKNVSTIEIVEAIFDPENEGIVKNSAGNSFTNEFMAFIFNKAITGDNSIYSSSGDYFKNVDLGCTSSHKQRSFIPGSQWLYYKIYSGTKMADKILTNTIKPLVEELLKRNLLEKWFFIRYADPETHLRVRFYHREIDKVNEICKIAYSYLNPLMENGSVPNICVDTYKREFERYGVNTIGLAEDFFQVDSHSTLELLNMINGPEGEEIKWIYAVKSADDLLDNFKYNTEEKIVFLNSLKNAFFVEHGGSKKLKLQLDAKYRSKKDTLLPFLNNKLENRNELHPIFKLLNERKKYIELISLQLLDIRRSNLLKPKLESLISSYIHMTVNRVFKSRQRIFEMVLYDMLYRFHKSEEAKLKRQIFIE